MRLWHCLLHLLSVSHSATLSPRVTRNDKYSKALVDTYATLRPHDPPLDQPVPSGPAQKFQVSSTQSSERGLLRLLIRQPLRVLALCSVEASGRYQIHVTLALEFDHAELDGLLAEFDGEEERLAIRMTDLTADFIQLQAYRLGVVAAPNPRGIFVEYMNDAQSVKAFVGREWITTPMNLRVAAEYMRSLGGIFLLYRPDARVKVDAVSKAHIGENQRRLKEIWQNKFGIGN